MAPFLITDEIGKANGFMNEFHMTLHQMVAQFSELIYVVAPDGTAVLTEVGHGMKNFVITAMKELAFLLKEGMILFKNYAKEAGGVSELLSMLTIPLRAVLRILQLIGPQGIQFILMFKVLNGLLPISAMMTWAMTEAGIANAASLALQGKSLSEVTDALKLHGLAGMYALGAIGLLVAVNIAFLEAAPAVAAAISMITGAVLAYGIAWMVAKEAMDSGIKGAVIAGVVGAVIGLAVYALTRKLMQPPKQPDLGPIPEYDIGTATTNPYNPPTMDTGGRIPMYDTGGRPHHRQVMVEPGETIISKTANMAGGHAGYGSGGVNIIIEGDVYDGDNFAEKISQALPKALNNASDSSSLAMRTSKLGSSFGKTAINRGSSITEGVQ